MVVEERKTVREMAVVRSFGFVLDRRHGRTGFETRPLVIYIYQIRLDKMQQLSVHVRG
jgi:hypothetical protein